VPMLQVWPSMIMLRVGLACSFGNRIVQQPQCFRPERRAIEVEVHILEVQLHDRCGRAAA